MPWFRNFYECPRDGTRWADEWSCTCDDRCPTCNASITPYDSVDLEATEERADADLSR